MKYTRILLICIASALALISLIGCHNYPQAHPENSTLRHVETLSNRHAGEAVQYFDSIDRKTLSKHDRHFYDFIRLKIADKLDYVHTDDSLILALIDYASQNFKPDDIHYTETLYYGGRVYSVMGDYPTALQYFQKALKALPDDDNVRWLRGNIISQTGRLLNNLRLYNEAIPYINQVIALNKIDNDTILEVYNLQLLGVTNIRAERYADAEICLREALSKCDNLPPSFIANTKAKLAWAKYEQGDIDSAYYYIRNTPDLVEPNTRNSALMDAVRIYHAKGMSDSAYMFAKEIIASDNPNQKDMAYHWLLLPELRQFSHPDTLIKYVYAYSALLEEFYDDNENQQAIAQQSLYNYRLHERERQRAEAANNRLKICIAGAIIAVLALVVIVLVTKNRSERRKLQLKQAIENIKALREELDQERARIEELTAEEEPEGEVPTIDELRSNLKAELQRLHDTHSNAPVSPIIIASKAYEELHTRIHSEEPMPDNDALWTALEQIVLKVSPRFKKNLVLLTGGRLSRIDYHTALLIKCGCKPGEIAILLRRGKSSIVSRRKTLSFKTFDELLPTDSIDTILRLL